MQFIKRFRVGQRAIKTAISVGLALALAMVLGSSLPIFAAIGAISVMSRTWVDSLKESLNQIAGTFLGYLIACVFVTVLPNPTFFVWMALGVLCVISLCIGLKLNFAIPLASIVFADVCLYTGGDSIVYGFHRFTDTLVGLVVALLVNVVIRPYNNRQKINDCLGNPVEIGIAVMWRVTDTAKAVFNVDNYKEYLSLQCDSALRNIVRIYPYDVAPNVDTTGDGVADEGSLRGSSEIVAGRIRDEIQQKVADAGLEIIEARITYLAYAPEIAAVMLQRQQASAIIDARKMIVDGAVGMVEMALERLNENNVVELDEERKAAMVSNLLVVLCGNHDAQPVVNSGSLY